MRAGFFDRTKEARRKEAFDQGFKLGKGRSRSPGSDPTVGEVSSNQGSGGKVCHTTEPTQTQKRMGVEVHSKPKATTP